MGSSDHWNHIYSSEPVSSLGWYEETPGPSIDLLEKCQLGVNDPILDVGAGASTFIDSLVQKGFQNLYALDISEVALSKLRSRVGEVKARRVKWIVEDITMPSELANLRNVALWHDRALLHFLTEEANRQIYKRIILNTVRPGGYAIIAAFSPQGAKRCSELDVRNYDQNDLAEFLGTGFVLKEWFDYLYTMPSGNLRPYVYTLFQRQSSPAQ
jgi:EEF1A lysine methyltransferase 2